MNDKTPKNDPAGISASIYVHIPFCQTKCRYCGFYSESVKNHDPARLISAITAEIGQYGPIKGLQTAYIGGGSPSCLPRELLLRLINDLPGAEEFTIEVNPGQVNEDILRKLHAAGVNRLSIGAQSFNSIELEFLGRRHSTDDIRRAVEAAKLAGFNNVGLDLIFAIPDSTLNSGVSRPLREWEKTIKTAIELEVQHISAYALTYEEDTPLQKAVEAGEAKPVDEETDRAMYEMVIDKLEKAGFRQYEISNFAKPGFECKHNLNYWANRPYIGIGPAAGSYWNGRRTLNVADIQKYIEQIENGSDAIAETEIPDKIQFACETAVLNLRRRSGIDLKEFKAATGFDAEELFAEPISKYKELMLIEAGEGRLFLTRKALPIADSVLCDFSDV
jgi:oxygen-independent coproporphyrinogen-3 oxidase